jgi:adenosylmethionine-8-amino-7-oxononanoate aminotransferase
VVLRHRSRQERDADAIATQVTAIEAYSTFDPFTNEPAERLADELRTIGPMPDSRVFFSVRAASRRQRDEAGPHRPRCAPARRSGR